MVYFITLLIARTARIACSDGHTHTYTDIQDIWTFWIYCKTLNISVPLMLAKLAMQYHSLTFVVAKIKVYCYACLVLCQVVSKLENGVLPVQLVAGKQSFLLLPSCDNPCICISIFAENQSVEQVWVKEQQKRGKYNHYDAEVRTKITKHACEYGNKSAL